MTDKHTHGPWTTSGEFDDFIVDSNDKDLALVSLWREERQANARLIAAAPELLEALEWLFHLVHGVGKSGGAPSTSEFDAAMSDAQAAIVKATGKEV